jgi:hypothetical protein
MNMAAEKRARSVHFLADEYCGCEDEDVLLTGSDSALIDGEGATELAAVLSFLSPSFSASRLTYVAVGESTDGDAEEGVPLASMSEGG